VLKCDDTNAVIFQCPQTNKKVLMSSRNGKSDPSQGFRELTKNVVREASKATSPFDSWSSDSLKSLLIEHNIQVRGSKQASHSTLVRICNELFGTEYNGDEKDFIKVYTMEQMLLMDRAARTIQWVYIEYRQRRYQPRLFRNLVIDVHEGQKNEAESYSIHYDEGEASIIEKEYDEMVGSYDEEEGQHDEADTSIEKEYDELVGSYDEEEVQQDDAEASIIEKEYDEMEGSYDEEERYEGAGGSFYEEDRKIEIAGSFDEEGQHEENGWGSVDGHNSTITSAERIPKHTGTEKEVRTEQYFPPDHILVTTPRKRNSNTKESSQRKQGTHLDQELETEWVKPSWRHAKTFESENRPHRAGKTMKPYSWKKVTLGRHCTVGGCGEQLDLWVSIHIMNSCVFHM